MPFFENFGDTRKRVVICRSLGEETETQLLVLSASSHGGSHLVLLTLSLDFIGRQGSELLSHVLPDGVLKCAESRVHAGERRMGFVEWLLGNGGERKQM